MAVRGILALVEGSTAFSGQELDRSNADFRVTVKRTVWNGRKPDRVPDLLLRPTDAEDLRRAVQFAAAHGGPIGVRSGGHSFTASSVRDGGTLIDVSALRGLEIDRDRRTAIAGPAVKSAELARAAADAGLFFPSGHYPGVALGGFLLQGGFGWNSRALGPACVSVNAIEAVTADGTPILADEKSDSDLLWAARGGGHGFFAAVQRYHLTLYDQPTIRRTLQVYGREDIPNVLRWLEEDVQPGLAPNVEILLFISRVPPAEQVAGTLIGLAYGADAEEAEELLRPLERHPLHDRALTAQPPEATDTLTMSQAVRGFYPDGIRLVADNVWTDAPVSDLLPTLEHMLDTLPGHPSHVLWYLWGPPPALPDMAFSMQAKVYLAVYAMAEDPDQDAGHRAWVLDHMHDLEPHAAGTQLADENLAERPAPFMLPDNWARFEAIRRRYDPTRAFAGFMGLPPEFQAS